MYDSLYSHIIPRNTSGQLSFDLAESSVEELLVQDFFSSFPAWILSRLNILYQDLSFTYFHQVVDLRTVSFDVPPQEILTKDSVTVAVDAVVYYKAEIDLSHFVKFIILYFQINNPLSAVCNVTNAAQSTRLLASTTLRNTLGTKTLQVLLFLFSEVQL